ncbi:MAG: hypothetical protein ACI4S9_01130, partial [Christensenellales bacterium]
MKKVLVLFVVLSLIFGFVGCTGNTPGGIETDEEGNVTGTIKIWGGSAPFHENYALGSVAGDNYDPDCYTSNELIKRIKEKYPKLNVVIENKGSSTTLNTALRNAKISNNMPDIVVGEQFIKSQIELDYYVPLEIPEETYKAIPEYLWEQSKGADGKQYG